MGALSSTRWLFYSLDKKVCEPTFQKLIGSQCRFGCSERERERERETILSPRPVNEPQFRIPLASYYTGLLIRMQCVFREVRTRNLIFYWFYVSHPYSYFQGIPYYYGKLQSTSPQKYSVLEPLHSVSHLNILFTQVYFNIISSPLSNSSSKFSFRRLVYKIF